MTFGAHNRPAPASPESLARSLAKDMELHAKEWKQKTGHEPPRYEMNLQRILSMCEDERTRTTGDSAIFVVPSGESAVISAASTTSRADASLAPQAQMSGDPVKALSTPAAERLMYAEAMQSSLLLDIGRTDVTPEALAATVKLLLAPSFMERNDVIWLLGAKMANAVDPSGKICSQLRYETIGSLAERSLRNAVIDTLALQLRPELRKPLLDQYKDAMHRWDAGKTSESEHENAVLQAALQAIRAQYEVDTGAANGARQPEPGARPGDVAPQAVGQVQERPATPSPLLDARLVEVLLLLCREGRTADVMNRLQVSPGLRELLLDGYSHGSQPRGVKEIETLRPHLLQAGIPQNKMALVEEVLNHYRRRFFDSVEPLVKIAEKSVDLADPSLEDIQARNVELRRSFDGSRVALDVRAGGFPVLAQYLSIMVLNDGTPLPQQLEELLNALETTFFQHDLPLRSRSSPRSSAVAWLCAKLAPGVVAPDKINDFVVQVDGLLERRRKVGSPSKNFRKDLAEVLESVNPAPSEPSKSNQGVSGFLKGVSEEKEALALRESELQQALLDSGVSRSIKEGGFLSFAADISWLVLRDGTAGPPQLEALLSELEKKCVDSKHTPVVNARRSATEWLGRALVADFLPPDKASAFGSKLSGLMSHRQTCPEPTEKLRKDLMNLLQSVR